MSPTASLSGDLVLHLDNGQVVVVGRIDLPRRVDPGHRDSVPPGPGAEADADAVRSASPGPNTVVIVEEPRTHDPVALIDEIKRRTDYRYR